MSGVNPGKAISRAVTLPQGLNSASDVGKAISRAVTLPKNLNSLEDVAAAAQRAVTPGAGLKPLTDLANNPSLTRALELLTNPIGAAIKIATPNAIASEVGKTARKEALATSSALSAKEKAAALIGAGSTGFALQPLGRRGAGSAPRSTLLGR